MNNKKIVTPPTESNYQEESTENASFHQDSSSLQTKSFFFQFDNEEEYDVIRSNN